MKNKLISAAAVLFLIIFLYQMMFDSKEVKLTRVEKMAACPELTVEAAANKFFTSPPKWRSGTFSGGLKYVNVSGDMMYKDKKVKGTIRFTVDDDGKNATFRGFEIDDVSQNNFVSMEMMNKICGITPPVEPKVAPVVSPVEPKLPPKASPKKHKK